MPVPTGSRFSSILADSPLKRWSCSVGSVIPSKVSQSNTVYKRSDSRIARHGVRSDGFDNFDFTITQIPEIYWLLPDRLETKSEAGW
jgi:hypothetical protein